jgi:hypothetical protein
MGSLVNLGEGGFTVWKIKIVNIATGEVSYDETHPEPTFQNILADCNDGNKYDPGFWYCPVWVD